MIKIENVEIYVFEAAIPIRGFPEYRIDPQGNVYNCRGKILKPEVCKNGYARVSLNNCNIKHAHKLVHRLVAEAFIPNPNGLPQVNHIDENKLNNNVKNLEWCTPLENLNHSGVIEKAWTANERKIRCITTGEEFNTIKEVEEKYNLCHSNLVACCRGRRNKCGGMEWEYIE